jgi:hypothetical protein
MKATALKNRAGRSPQSAAGHERVVGDHGVGASAAGGAHVSGGVEREGRHIQTQAVGAADVIRRHGPLGRNEVVVVVGCRWRNASLMACTESRLVLTPGRRCRATSRFGAMKLWMMSWRRGMRLASTASMTLFAYAGVESKSGSPGTFLIVRSGQRVPRSLLRRPVA